MQVVIVERDSEKLMMEINGALDWKTVPTARKVMLKAIKKQSPGFVEIHAHGLESVDTAGLALLVEIRRILQKKSVSLRMAGLDDGVLRMIRLARLDDVLGDCIVQ